MEIPVRNSTNFRFSPGIPFRFRFTADRPSIYDTFIIFSIGMANEMAKLLGDARGANFKSFVLRSAESVSK